MKQQSTHEEDEYLAPQQPRATVRELHNPSYEYSFPIDSGIGDLANYDELLTILRNATENDVVIISINSPGGSLHTAQVIVDEINACEATTIASVAGECASAATMVALACDRLYTTPNSSWLFHNMSTFGLGGKNSDVIAFAEHSKQLAMRIAEQHYKHFLPDSTISDLLKGEEIYMFGNDVLDLWEARQELRTKDAEDISSENTSDEDVIGEQIGLY